MRGPDDHQSELFSYIPLEARVPEGHPLRPIRRLVDSALGRMHGDFRQMYSHTGRPSIAPEQLLRALLLQVLYTIRSERQLVEHIRFNLLYRWFVGLGSDDEVWDASTFSRNRDRLLAGEVAEGFFREVLREAESKRLVSKEHFTVDGTLVEAWASHKSFVKREGVARREDGDDDRSNPTMDFKGEKRSNQTHESTTDWQARLFRKSRNEASKLSYMGHVLMENRNGLAVRCELTPATGTAERQAALRLVGRLQSRKKRRTLGLDKGYDVKRFIEEVRAENVVPHVATYQNIRHYPSIDERTTRHPGYGLSQRARKRVEEIFGWLKTIGLGRKTRFRGTERVGWMFTFSLAAYNLVRIRNLTMATG